jgi:vacuolar-type H+-ATPase subunit H
MKDARQKAQQIVDSWDLDERLQERDYEGLKSAIEQALQEAAKVDWPEYEEMEQDLLKRENELELPYDWSIATKATYNWLKSRLKNVGE